MTELNCGKSKQDKAGRFAQFWRALSDKVSLASCLVPSLGMIKAEALPPGVSQPNIRKGLAPDWLVCISKEDVLSAGHFAT